MTKLKFKEEIFDTYTGFGRKLLHEAIDEYAYYDFLDDVDDEDLREETEEELEKIHKLISNDNFSANPESYFWIGDEMVTIVDETDLLANALKEAGYSVKSSGISSSLYITLENGEELRVADHKRPAYSSDNSSLLAMQLTATNQQYENELIIKGNLVAAKSLKKFGIELDEEFYYLF